MKGVQVWHGPRVIPRQHVGEPTDGQTEVRNYKLLLLVFFLFPHWEENFVLIDVGRVLVVVSVGQLPRVVGHQDGRVKHVADHVVD